MNILEQEIEQIVWDALHNHPEILDDRGFPFDSDKTYVRQLELGSYGRADIVGFHVDHNCIYIDIIELKKDQIQASTLFQAIKYAKGIERLIETFDPEKHLFFDFYLIGKTIETKGDFCYSTDYFENVHFYIYSIDLICGLKFTNESGFFIREEDFCNCANPLKKILNENILKNNPESPEEDEEENEEVQDDLPF